MLPGDGAEGVGLCEALDGCNVHAATSNVTSGKILATRPVTLRSLPVDLRSIREWRVDQNSVTLFTPCDGSPSLSRLCYAAFLISSFGEDESGELYLVNLAGAIYRFDPA
jgi:hypothetical protein